MEIKISEYRFNQIKPYVGNYLLKPDGTVLYFKDLKYKTVVTNKTNIWGKETNKTKIEYYITKITVLVFNNYTHEIGEYTADYAINWLKYNECYDRWLKMNNEYNMLKKIVEKQNK